MSRVPWLSLGCWVLAISLVAGCSNQVTCANDGCDDAGGVDAGAMDASQRVVDAGQPDGGAVDGGSDAGQPDAGPVDSGVADAGPSRPVLTDYVQCDLDIDCPSGLGRCQKTLPLHHADLAGNLGVPASQVFANVPAGKGICAETCEQNPTACSASPYLTRSLTFSCQLVYGAPSPYTLGAGVDAGPMAAGIAFAAVCRPPLGNARTCGACTTDTDCAGGRCWDLAADAPYAGTGSLGTCVSPCSTLGACPGGFSCTAQALDAGSADLCLPSMRTCGACTDLDRDLVGVGFCGVADSQGNPTVTPVDCLDTDATSYWRAQPVCGAVDHDCNGFADSTDMVGTDAYGSVHCTACNDACPTPANAGTPGVGWACVGPTGNRACVATCTPGRLNCDANPDCEVGPATPGFQFAPDPDHDGFACNPVPGSTTCSVQTACTAPPNYASARAYSASPTTCADAGPGACPDLDEDHPTVYPGAPERCDGLDNDQNGLIDDGFLVADAGACLDGSLPVNCPGNVLHIGASCSATCGSVTGPGAWRCNGTGGLVCTPNAGAPEVACNGLDDNCDGVVDEPVGTSCTRPAGTLDSPCWQAAKYSCSGPALTCTQGPNTHANDVDVPGDGFDADCDGRDTQAKNVVYVYSGYSSPVASDGSKTRPFITLDKALQASPKGNITFYLQDSASGPVLTNTTIVLGPGLRIYGGFTGGIGANGWVEPSTTSPVKTRVCMPMSAKPATYSPLPGVFRAAWVGMTCTSTDPARPAVFRNITLEVAHGNGACGPGLDTPGGAPVTTGWGWSVYGAIFKDCDEIILRDVTINTYEPPDAGVAAAVGAGATGASGGQALNAQAGGRGGAGASGSSPLVFGQNGSSAAPSATPNSLGGAGGLGFPLAGLPPTTHGSTGVGGATPTPSPLMAAIPKPNATSTYLTAEGYLQFNSAAAYFGGPATIGDFGYGGGGGGSLFNFVFNYPPGGSGGQGGGSGPAGVSGGGGGDNVGLVLLGSQLPADCATVATPNVSSCGSNVTVNAGTAGAGGDGSAGGAGGTGGAYTAGLTLGGQGGKGCGGGGAAGGRGGISLGLARDFASLGNDLIPAWLTPTASTGGTPGIGAAPGGDGASGGDYTCTVRANAAGAGGLAGLSFNSAMVPIRSCTFATIDSDYTPGSVHWVMNAAGTEVAPTKTCP